MNTLKNDWHVGQPVWAALGTFGWRPAVITGIGSVWIQVLFQSGKGACGKRQPEHLRSRDPRLRGEDKPQPLKEEE